MRLGRLILVIVCPILLWANEVTFNGTFYKGTIDRYCIKPLEDTSFEMKLDSSRTNCLTFLDSSGELGKDCSKHSYLYADNLTKGVTYYIIEARLKSSSTTTNYTLWVNASGDIQAGVCPSYALAKAAGTTGEQMAFMMSLSGLVIAVLLFGSITYIILTIKEW